MERVIVHVRRHDESRGRDLEVPAEVRVDELTQRVAAALKWGAKDSRVSYQIMAHPQNCLLPPDKTLVQLDVWDGSTLVFQPVSPG